MKMIDAKQKQLIHIAQGQLRLSEESYRAIIGGRTKGRKSSSKDLTYFEADAVINYMVTLGFKIKSKHVAKEHAAKQPCREHRTRRPENLYCLASRDQLQMINVLAGKIKWKVEDGFRRWLKKYIKIDQIKTDDEASDVIEGLKGMLANTLKGTSREWSEDHGNRLAN